MLMAARSAAFTLPCCLCMQSAVDIHGRVRKLDEFRGKALIITNVASKVRPEDGVLWVRGKSQDHAASKAALSAHGKCAGWLA